MPAATKRLALLCGNLQRARAPAAAPNPATQALAAGARGVESAAEVRAHERSTLPAAGGREWEMSDEELYLFDTMGFLRVRNVLDRATVAAALESSQRIVQGGEHDHLLLREKGQM